MISPRAAAPKTAVVLRCWNIFEYSSISGGRVTSILAVGVSSATSESSKIQKPAEATAAQAQAQETPTEGDEPAVATEEQAVPEQPKKRRRRRRRPSEAAQAATGAETEAPAHAENPAPEQDAA